ncbi:hypothetical protein H8E07_05585 [bacterium]|nr:hypothetical protein [bacterium]
MPLDASHLIDTTAELSYVDPAGPGTWFYRVSAVDAHENESGGSNEVVVQVTSSAAPGDSELPSSFVVRVRGRNPFVDQITFTLELPEESEVETSIYGADGRRIAQLAHGTWPAGRHDFRWDGRNTRGLVVPAGVYFCRFNALGGQRVKQVSVLR